MKYKLYCNNCFLTFDSWFSSSDEYEKLKKKKLLNCYSCNSQNVKKTLMAPKLISKKLDKSSEQNLKKMKKNFEEYRKIVEKNFDYVGENFAYEARSIHYKESKRDKGIYGTASKKDLIELKEEGIETQVVPWIQDKNN